MNRFRSEKFPKLSVCLYAPPPNPEKIIAHNYLECIEDRQIDDPNEIDIADAKSITEHVIQGGHTPALESLLLGFNIRGMSKVVSHQIVRHRIGVSIGQRTQRANSKEYLGKFYNGEHFILPPSLQQIMAPSDGDPDDNPDLMHLHNYMHNYLEQSQKLYNKLINYGISEDEARYIIPQGSETSMDFNIILKALMFTASTRLCHVMQGEMVEVFRLIKKAVDDWHPGIGSLLKPICEITGKCNRNENNATVEKPKGACLKTINGEIPVRDIKTCFDLTKYSKDADK